MWSSFVPDWHTVEQAAGTSVTTVTEAPTSAPSVFIGIVLLVSTFFGLKRGFSRELFALAGWILAPVLAVNEGAAFAAWAFPTVGAGRLNGLLGFGAVFLIVLLVSNVLTSAFCRMVRRSLFSGADRILGAAFGLFRGGVIIVTLFFVSAWMTPSRTMMTEGEGLSALSSAASAVPSWSSMTSMLPSRATVTSARQSAATALSRFLPSALVPHDATRHDLAGRGNPDQTPAQRP